MRGKIELEYPYSTKWEHGYVYPNGENRRHVYLVKGGKVQTATSYARYLVAVNEGRFLNPDEHIDHIDNDKTNDVLENLQIVTVAENNKKQARYNGSKVAEIQCPICKYVFIRRAGNTQAVKSRRNAVTCCSKKCSYEFKSRNYSKEERIQISAETLLRVFQQHG